MNPTAGGWDREERETLAPFQQELDAIRASQALSQHDRARLLRRIKHEAGQSPAHEHDAGQSPARAAIFWTWPWLMAAASVLIVAGAICLPRGLR